MSITELAAQDSLVSILIRFLVNLFVIFILIRLIYYRFSKKEENLFSYFLMGTMIFMMVSLLEKVDVQIGMALGLFALFAIIRFRTMNMSAKDMTYFFTTIGISIINSQADLEPPVVGALLINSIIIGTALILELYLQGRIMNFFTVSFSNINLLGPGTRKELLSELTKQTGYKIEKVRIEKINIDKNNADLTVFFFENNK
jgi:hypothetical protein